MKNISLKKDILNVTAVNVGTSAPRLSGFLEANSLPNLVSLTANNNDIEDFIFSTTNNNNLRDVRLDGNRLTGVANTYIPENLNTVSLDRNLLTSVTSLESYINLESFSCSENTIASLPALHSNMTTFKVSKNGLTGDFYPFINSYPTPAIKNLQINGNSFTGSLPIDTFSNRPNLITFKAGENNLTGRIPILDFNVGLINFEVDNNAFSGWASSSVTGNTWPSSLPNQVIKMQNNELNRATLNTLLTTLVDKGALNGTINLSGTNSLPISGNYNPSKLTLESRGWTVEIPGGIDTTFSTSQNYTSIGEALEKHPDWEGRPESAGKPDQWAMDGANSKITCKNVQDLPGGQQTMRNIRNVHPIVAKVGSKVRISADFDYGPGPFTTDFTRTFMLSLADMGSYPLNDEFVLNYPNESFLINFRNISGIGDVARLYRRKGVGVSSDYIGDLDLSSIDGNILRLQIDFEPGASAAVSTMTISYENLTDSTGMTKNGVPANPQVITGFLDVEATRGGKFYTSLISPSSEMKINIQAGELEDTSIVPAGEITVHNAFLKSIWDNAPEWDVNIDWDLTSVPVTSFDPAGNVNDRPRINTFREDDKFIEYLSAGGIYEDPNTHVTSTPPWGDRSTGSYSTNIPVYDHEGTSTDILDIGVDVFAAEWMTVTLVPSVENWTVTTPNPGEKRYQYIIPKNSNGLGGTANLSVTIT